MPNSGFLRGRRHRVHRVECILIWLVGVLVFSGRGGCAEPPSRWQDQGACMRDKKLALECNWRSGTLEITLRNVSKVPVIIDKDLVFGLAVDLEDRLGKPVSQEEVSTVKADVAAIRRRLVVVEPGRCLTRTIDLTKPFRVFVTARSLPSHRIVAYEADWRVPRLDAVRRVVVSYGSSGAFRDGFEQYLGISPEKVSLCLSAAVAECPKRKVKSKEESPDGGPTEKRNRRVDQNGARGENESPKNDE